MAESSASGSEVDRHLGELGYAGFRPGQREAISTLLDTGRLLLVAPTGGGKSLCYQLPALLLGGTSIVVSPLIALMNDQVAALRERGVAATFLASTLEAAETRARTSAIAHGEVRIVYVAPERLVFPGFQELVARLRPPLVAIDEAHCISEWGHDFRPEYLSIGPFLAATMPRHILACTATATPIVRDEILARLSLAPDTPQIVQGFARPNLALGAREVATRRAREEGVDEMLARALGKPQGGHGTAIVYSPTRRLAEEEAARIAEAGWRVDAYHAGLDPGTRERVQAAFREGGLEVVVATNAFGMGIDRADVRVVVHLAPPSSIEAYYQEVGRAGRDGRDAWGLLLVSPGDAPLRRRLIEQGAGTVPPAELVEHKWALFLELLRWAEGGGCRHDAILRYFGDEAETLDGCGRCDNCLALAAPDSAASAEETTVLARKALSAVARIDGRFGLQAAAKLLRGEDDPRLQRSGLDQTPTFGALRDRAEEWLLRLLRRCVTAGWVDFRGDDRPVVVLTPEGRAVMKAERPARIVLPPDRIAAPGSRRSPAGKGTKRALPDDLDATALELFEALRRRRLEIAREEKVPPYVVASDRTLRDVAMLRPRNLEELKLAHGIAEAKATRYGERLLAVVRSG